LVVVKVVVVGNLTQAQVQQMELLVKGLTALLLRVRVAQEREAPQPL
jgi:hypothetical protein